MNEEDPNYVAKLEKAIAQKYGKEAIQNPNGNWDEEKEKKYLEQLKKVSVKEQRLRAQEEKINADGFLINKKLLSKESNRVCPVCETYSFKAKDDVYMNKFECCFNCYIKHVEGREERWLSGWRPKGE
jgi:DNA replication protein DnaC